jgi:hypothetical protein
MLEMSLVQRVKKAQTSKKQQAKRIWKRQAINQLTQKTPGISGVSI